MNVGALHEALPLPACTHMWLQAHLTPLALAEPVLPQQLHTCCCCKRTAHIKSRSAYDLLYRQILYHIGHNARCDDGVHRLHAVKELFRVLQGRALVLHLNPLFQAFRGSAASGPSNHSKITII